MDEGSLVPQNDVRHLSPRKKYFAMCANMCAIFSFEARVFCGTIVMGMIRDDIIDFWFTHCDMFTDRREHNLCMDTY